MSKRVYLIGALLAAIAVVGTVAAQRGGGRFNPGGGDGGGMAPQRELPATRAGVDNWPIDEHFRADSFTFTRVSFRSGRFSDAWLTDFPDSELNFSFRLQQMTSLKVNPVPKQVGITDAELFDYPFVYMLEVATLEFTDDEVVALRRYLTNGGFLMVDDFWGEQAWELFHKQMQRVFPDREPTELALEHPIFHCVFDLKEKPQIPGIDAARRARRSGTPEVTWESGDSREPHYRAYLDDKGRMMVLMCHNTDLGDGWEREGEEEWYFKQFSESKGYPMGINIIFYAMTH